MELLIELIGEGIARLIAELLGGAVEHAIGRPHPPNKWMAYLGCIVLGGFLGMITTALFSEPIFARRITGISVLIAPLITATLMYLAGLWLQRRAAKPGTLTSSSGAWVFAVAFSSCRLWILTRS